MLHEAIKNGIKEAMLAKDADRLKAVRNMLSAFTNDLVARNKKPTELLSDDEAVAVISRLAKQRRDSIEQFQKGGRADLVKEEEAELAILKKFLPELLSKSEVEKLAKIKKEELNINDPTKKGMLMQSLMKDLKGKADGTLVKEVVDSLL